MRAASAPLPATFGATPLTGLPRELLAVGAVVAPVRPQARGDRQVAARPPALAGERQRPPEAEVGVVVYRVALDDGLELDRRLPIPAGPKVGSAPGPPGPPLVGRPPR